MKPTPSGPFAGRLRSRGIYLVRGKDSTGRSAWYYLRVCKKSPLLFERDARKGQIQLADYGEILCSGYGENPPESAVRDMRENWGFQS